METYFHPLQTSNAIRKCEPLRKSIWPPVGAALCLGPAALWLGSMAYQIWNVEALIPVVLFLCLEAFAATIGLILACVRIVQRLF